MEPNFVDKIIKKLISSQLSNYKISQDTGISDETIANYRKGKSKPRGANLAILSNYLDNQLGNVTHSGNTTSYTGTFHDVSTQIGGSRGDTIVGGIKGDGNAVGSGNNTGNVAGGDNRISYAQQRKAARLGVTPNNEATELRHEVERLKAEIEHLKTSLELKDSIIKAKDDMIQILMERK